jgi:hypothetical protein
MKRAAFILLMALATTAISPLFAPQLLAFPHSEQLGSDRIYSTAPIDREQAQRVVERSRTLLAESPISLDGEPRHIFLTDGGWRWKWLALQSAGGFGLTRMYNEDVILNRSDLGADKIHNGLVPGGERTLSGVIAHEKCHGAIRRHFGFVRAQLAPQLLVEGYCDHVAQESSLSDADVSELEESGSFHPALPYYHGRKKVAATLDANGSSVDRLFDDWE